MAALEAIWNRREREWALDLRKGASWKERAVQAEYRERCAEIVRWMGDELRGRGPEVEGGGEGGGWVQVVPEMWKGARLRERLRGLETVFVEAGRLMGSAEGRGERGSVSPLAVAICPFVTKGDFEGSKAVDNMLSKGVAPNAHAGRWIRLLVNLADGASVEPEVLVFHRRSRRAVGAWLAGWPERIGRCDVRDVLVWHSLLALWQRRRRKAEVRASRGDTDVSRWKLAKPIAALNGELIQGVAQFRALVMLAQVWGGSAGAALAGVVLEGALSQAHLYVHVPGYGGRDEKKSGDRRRRYDNWLDEAERGIQSLEPLIGVVEAACFRLRVAFMRARAGQRAGAVSGELVRVGREVQVPKEIAGLPHVRALIRIGEMEAARGERGGGERGEERTGGERFAPDAEGVLMLLPQLRKHGLLEEQGERERLL